MTTATIPADTALSIASNLTKITAADVLSIMRELVEPNPDFTYETVPFVHTDSSGDKEAEPTYECAYYDADGDPSCIVGHVFARLVKDGRLPAEEFGAETFLADSDRGAQPRPLLDPLNLENLQGVAGHPRQENPRTSLRRRMDGAALAALTEAQLVQDRGETWGVALTRAERAVAMHNHPANGNGATA